MKKYAGRTEGGISPGKAVCGKRICSVRGGPWTVMERHNSRSVRSSINPVL